MEPLFTIPESLSVDSIRETYVAAIVRICMIRGKAAKHDYIMQFIATYHLRVLEELINLRACILAALEDPLPTILYQEVVTISAKMDKVELAFDLFGKTLLELAESLKPHAT